MVVLVAAVMMVALGVGSVSAPAAHASSGAAAASVSLQVNESPITAGTSATVTVTVAAQAGSVTPTGTVAVTVDGTTAGDPIALIGGSAVWHDASLSVGAHQITADYQGDATFAVASAAAVSIVVLPQDTSSYVPLPPARILDTRSGPGQVGYGGGQPGAQATVPVQVTGMGGVPKTGVSGVVLNVTATNSVAPGFVTVWPSQSPRPLASILNLRTAGQTVANLAVTPVGPDGQVDLFTLHGTDLVADVQGYFTASTSSTAGRLVSLTPARILDTRSGPRQIGYGGGRPGPHATVPVQVTGAGNVPASGVSAVALNVTATDATAPGFVTMWPAGQPRPLASNLNVTVAGQTKANAVWVPVGAGGVVDVFVQSGADVVVDVDGYFTDGSATDSSAGLFVPTQPSRLLDTRTATQTGYVGGEPAAGATVPLQLRGRAPIGAADVAAVVGNTTVTDTVASGYVTVWPTGVARPLASNVNLTGAGDTEATLTTSPLGSDGGVDLYTLAGADLIFDVAGYFTADLTAGGTVTEHATDQPAGGTTVFQPSQVVAVNPGPSGTVVVLGAGVGAPAVGAGVVVLAGAASADGATGQVTAVTHNSDGTTSVTLTPTTLDSLYSSMSLGYDGPADLALTGSNALPRLTQPAGGPGGGGFNFANAFDCTSSGVAVAVASLTFENTSVHFALDLGVFSTPHAAFTMSTEPVVEFSATVSGQVSCTLKTAFQNAFELKWVFPAGGVPVVVTVQPTLTFTASATGNFDVTEHFYRTIGFETKPDLSLRLINNGGQHVTSVNVGATLQASLAFGAEISVRVLDVAGVKVDVGPKFVATSTTVNTQTCITLTAELDGSVSAELNLWFKTLTSKSIDGKLGPWTLYTSCPVKVTTASLPAGFVGQSYDTVLAATGGTGPYTWSVTDGALPDGLTLSDQGEISGTPTIDGVSDFTVQATDTLGANGKAALTMNVDSNAQCVWSGGWGAGFGSVCDSTNPTVEVAFTNTGDTSACTFTSDIDWGDGTPVEVFNFAGSTNPTDPPVDHTFTNPGNYVITFTDMVDTGNCTFTSGSIQYTLDPSASNAAGHASRAGQPKRATSAGGPRTAVG
jgi:hypothetical protein